MIDTAHLKNNENNDFFLGSYIMCLSDILTQIFLIFYPVQSNTNLNVVSFWFLRSGAVPVSASSLGVNVELNKILISYFLQNRLVAHYARATLYIWVTLFAKIHFMNSNFYGMIFLNTTLAFAEI